MRGVCVEGGGGEAYLYYLEVGFPPTHVWKVIRCLGVTPPRSVPGREPGQVRPTQGVGRPHLAASRPYPSLAG